MSHKVVKLTVINDLICPNCYIGQHELLSAIATCKDTLKLPLDFEVEYMPFRLISTAVLPDDSPKIDKQAFFTRRFGPEKFASLDETIHKWAEEKGVPISFRGIMSQSTRAHRLSRKAFKIGGHELQLPVLIALFKTHLEEGKDIADLNVLAEVAESVGMMSKDQALKFLKTDELEAEVNTMCDDIKAKGVTGVPLTLINGKWAVSGGQSSDVFVQIFKKMAENCCEVSQPVKYPVPVMGTHPMSEIAACGA